MADQNILIAASAFSGLAGALMTQSLTGLFNYFGDRRKSSKEIRSQYRNKQIEIAENYYFVTGETMDILQKSIRFWKNRHDARSPSSLEFMSLESKKTAAALDKLRSTNWQHNLVGLYFKVSLSQHDLNTANTKSHELYLKVLDLADQLARTPENEREALYGLYNLSIFDLCNQYDQIYALLESDMEMIKAALKQAFEC